MNDTVKGSKKPTSANTITNAISFLASQLIRDTVNTAEVVVINAADAQGTTSAGGYASATPLITQTDAYNNALPSAELHQLPVFRHQAGRAAIIMEPQPGDKALAVFTKRDSSGLKVGDSTPQPPASFRNYDQADGFLLNGFLGEPPEIWLLLDPKTGTIELSTKSARLDISCRESGDITIATGSGNVTIQAGAGGSGTITLDGEVVVTRTLKVHNKNGEPGGSHMTGGFSNTGGVVASNGVTLETHTHANVQPGSGNTGAPNAG